MQNFGGEAMLGLDHVANGELGKFHEGLRLAVRGRSGDAVGDGVHEDDEVAGAVHHLRRSNELHQVLRFAAEPRGPEDGVGLFGVELSESAVAEAEVVDDAAVAQMEVAQVGKLLRAFGLGLRSLGRLRALSARRSGPGRSEEHTSELQSLAYLVCRLLLEKK